MIKEIEKTILELSKDPKEADTVKALQKQIKNMKSKICTHGEYTNQFWGNKECRPCGSPKTVLCKINAKGRRSHSSKECRRGGCGEFESEKFN